MSKKYTVTSALPYANGPLHIGHIAGAYLPADIYVRYRKAKGDDVLFVCGSDEHGAAITLRAKKESVSPQEIVDKYHAVNEKAFSDLGIKFDIFHRTSSELHHQTASEPGRASLAPVLATPAPLRSNQQGIPVLRAKCTRRRL